MRKKLIIVLLLLLGKGIEAQNTARYGIFYAPAIAKIDPQGVRSNRWKYGQQIAFFRRWHTGNRFVYRLGLGYSYLHMEKFFINSQTKYTSLTDYKHQDLILPFQVQYYLSTKPNRWYGAAGVMPAVKLSRKVIGTYTTTHYPPSVSDITKSQHYPGLEGFISLSAGYEFALRGGSRFYIQPGMQANLPTKLYFRYHDTFNNYEPPPVGTIGVEFGYLFR